MQIRQAIISQPSRQRTAIRCGFLLMACAVAGLFTSSLLHAQEYLAKITGTVTDTSGAVIPGAKVSAENDSTHFLTPATTNQNGAYTIPFLTPGTYSVTVEAKGFQRAEKTGIVLTASAGSEVDIQLHVGSETMNVTVTANTSVLHTGTATLGQVLTRQEVTTLPNLGSNPFVMATLTAGTYSGNFVTGSSSQYNQPYSGTASQMQINGLGNEHQLELNGMPDDAPERLSAVTYTDFVPAPEAVQEVNTQTLLVDAQYGHSDGAVINTIIRSGQNRLHGAAYYKMQNTDLNANSYQRNAANEGRSVDNWQEPGFVLDGPVYIPKIYNGHDKTFFTVAYDRIQTKTPNPYTTWVPTDAERKGDFSGLCSTFNSSGFCTSGIQLYNPNSPLDANGNRTEYFPNNDISGVMNPIAAKLINYYPQPNTSSTAGNYVSPDDTINDHYWSIITRIDQQIGQSQKLTGLFFRSIRNQLYPTQGFPNNGIGSPGYIHFRNDLGASLDWVSIFSPTLVLDSRVGFVYHPFSLTNYGTGIDLSTLGFPSALTSTLPLQTFPGASFSGGVVGYGSETGGGGQASQATATSWTEVLSKSLQKHSLKGGIEFDGLRYNINTPYSNFGTFSYNRQFTQQNYLTGDAHSGDPMASFLLGYPSGGSVAWNIRPAYQQDYWGAFVQDDWRIRQNLTLNLGLRWDYEAPMTERYNRMNAGFCYTCTNPLQADVSGLTLDGGLLFTSAKNRLPYTKDLGDWQPRLGAAWQVHPNLVFRGGFGIIYLPTFDAPGNAGYSASTSYVSSTNGGETPATSLSNPYPSGIVTPTGSSLGLETLLGQSLGPVDHEHKPPRMYFGAVGMEYQMPWSTTMQVMYVSNATRRYQVSKGINALPSQYFSEGASVLNAKVPNPMAGLIPSNGNLNGTTITYQNLLVPYPEFGSVTEYDRPLGSTSYNALQIIVNKRFNHGFSAQADYTWAKEMNQTTFLNAQDSWNDIYRDEASTPNRIFNIFGSYQIPTAFHQSRFGRELLGGWQVNADMRTNDGSLIGTPTGSGVLVYPIVGTPQAANRTMAHQFNTCYIDANGVINSGGPTNTVGSCSYGDGAPAWQEISSSFTLNKEGPFMHNIRTWVHPVADASLFKTFVVREGVTFQLRGEFYNVFNQVNWGSPNTNITSTGSSGFGVLAANQGNDPRIGQVEARFNF